MNDDGPIELSRRRVLGGLGAVGVASAGAALGTSAYFSDEESFDDNVLTAGSLDLLVDYYSYWDQGTAGNGSVSGTADGEAVSAELSDVKPGDSGVVAFCPRIETNPAYLWLCGELTADDENELTEPEAEVDETTGPWNGELAQSVQVAVNYCDVADGAGEDFDPEDLGSQATIWQGSLADFLLASQTGLALDGEGTVTEDGGFPAPGEQACFAGTDDEAESPCLCIDWWVPTDVGNEIQTDSVAFDLTFYAEQCRHNDGTANPCVDETFTAPYVNDEGSATQIDGTLRMDVTYGSESIAYRVTMDDDDSGPKMSDPLNSVTNVWIPFDTDDDGTMDFQLQWHPGGGLPSDPFGYKAHSGGSWSGSAELPAGVSAAKSGESFVFVVPKSTIGSTGDAYRVGAHMSAGGEAPYAAISTNSSTGEIVPSGDFSSSDYLLSTTVQ